MATDFDAELEYRRRQELREKYDYLKDFNLSSYTMKKFADEIASLVVGLDIDIRTNSDMLNQLQKALKEERDKPDYKALAVNDPWFNICKRQDELVKLLFRISAYKTWAFKVLVCSNNKFEEFARHMSESFLELKKVEAQRDMWQDLFKMAEAKVGQAGSNPQQADLIMNQMEKQNQVIAGMTQQLDGFNELFNQMKKAPASISPPTTATVMPGNLTPPVRKAVEAEIPIATPTKLDRQLAFEEDESEEPEEPESDGEDEELDDEDEEDTGGGEQHPKVAAETQAPATAQSAPALVDSFTLGSLEEEQAFFDEIVKEHNLEPLQPEDTMMLYLESPEEVEHAFAVKAADITKGNVMPFLRRILESAYTVKMEAICAFLNVSRTKFKSGSLYKLSKVYGKIPVKRHFMEEDMNGDEIVG